MELELVRWLRDRLPQNKNVLVGPGDDAAVLRPTPGMELVVTTDMLMDGIDFELAQCSPQIVGRKSLAVNLSDLAAMAAKPVAAFISLALPRSTGLTLAQGLYEGMFPLAKQHQLAIAGGDTNSWNGPLCVNVTMFGEVASDGALLRSGALPGDELIVTGSFGGSILGHHFDFEPRVQEALQLAEDYEIHAALDVSDGLALDVSRLGQESRCGVVIDFAAVPVSAAARELTSLRANGMTPLDHALSDGEDFELVLAVPPEEANRLLREQPLAVPLTRIGRCIPRLGLFGRDHTGQEHILAPRGYQH
jgi:thiamine-monophosphate kinase